MRTVEILQYTLRKGSGATFHAIMQEISVPFTNATGSMLFRLATRFMTRITTTSFAPLTALKKWLRCSMLFMQVMTGAAAHAKTLFAASKPALKQ
ncbi:MAG: hypothetical protein L0F89_07715 [Lactococcus raffinolactis]|nr:hypothetical protein [Lactococcus raffinolactis]